MLDSASSPLPSVWTNDDIGAGLSPQLATQLDLLERLEIPGVFFIIPDNGRGTLDQDVELLRMIEAARNKGHEFYQHGYKHTAFECGVPALTMIMDIDPRAAALYESDREGVEALHTLEAQVEMLEKGQKIWRKAFGEDSVGFRPGWGAFCTNFYKALSLLGYQWTSSRFPSLSTYQQQVGRPVAFQPGVKTEPHRPIGGVWEFPIGAEVGYYIPNSPEMIREMVELGLDHQRQLQQRGHPSLLVSHHHGLSYRGSEGTMHAYGTGYEIHETLIPEMQRLGLAEFTTMSQLVAATCKP